MEEFTSGSSVTRHLFMSTDWDALLLKDASKKGKAFKGRRVPLRNLRQVRRGCGDGHMKRTLAGGRRAMAVDDRALSISAGTLFVSVVPTYSPCSLYYFQ
jgi:hypothetical protein